MEIKNYQDEFFKKLFPYTPNVQEMNVIGIDHHLPVTNFCIMETDNQNSFFLERVYFNVWHHTFINDFEHIFAITNNFNSKKYYYKLAETSNVEAVIWYNKIESMVKTAFQTEDEWV